MAHKKAAWSAKNLRDSNPKYRGVKVFGWQTVTAWNIVVRQKGCKYEAGKNVYMWKDFSIHANIDWVVVFSKAKKAKFNGRKYLKTYVNVVDMKEYATILDEKAGKKVEEKKVVEKKAPAKKATAAKKSTTKAPAKKATAKKVVTKSATEKKTTTKKTTTTKKAEK